MKSVRFFPHWSPNNINQVIGYIKLVNKITGILGNGIHWVEIGGFRGESATLTLGFDQIIQLDIIESNNELASGLRTKFAGIEHVRIVEDLSTNASQNYINQSIDVVYIDADHEYDSVVDDINCWLPKIREGGVICGHDYHNGFPGVIKAVDGRFKNKTVFNDSSWMAVVG